MDRVKVEPSQLPAAEDILTIQLNILKESARLIKAMTGGNTAVDGMFTTPTSPASMAVQVSSGTIYYNTVIDSNSFGVLGPDYTGIMKAGSYDGQIVAVSSPANPGTDIVLLVQATFQETDSDPQVLDYYNAANPAQPFSGPGNNGVAEYTKRIDRAIVGLKAGAPAATGQAVAPSPDPGYVPLATILIPYGTTSITAGNITLSPSTPRFRGSLLNIANQTDLSVYATLQNLNDATATLNNNIGTEKTERSDADGILNQNLANEIEARANADTNIANTLNAFIGRFAGTDDGQAGRLYFLGYIIQWGQGFIPPPPSANFSSTGNVAFSATYPDHVQGVWITLGGMNFTATSTNSNSQYGYQPTVAAANLTQSGFQAHGDNLGSGQTPQPYWDKFVCFNWISIGK